MSSLFSFGGTGVSMKMECAVAFSVIGGAVLILLDVTTDVVFHFSLYNKIQILGKEKEVHYRRNSCVFGNLKQTEHFSQCGHMADAHEGCKRGANWTLASTNFLRYIITKVIMHVL
jgi:hypothetical protein